jgi:hypothetical protein
MTTERQVASNRSNSQHSTGPTTEAGKATACKNSTAHGLTASRLLILHDEDEAEFLAFRDGIVESLAPIGGVEQILADRVASCAWRLRRVVRLEHDILADGIHAEVADRARDAFQTAMIGTVDPLADSMSKALPEDLARLVEEGRRRAQRAANARTTARTLVGMGFARSTAIERLTRYERGLEGSMHRNLHELERLQRARAGIPTPPPIAVDLDVTASGVEPEVAP